MQNFLTVAQQVLVLFILIGVGFALSKKNILTEKGAKACSELAMFIATPCVIIKAFQRPYTPALMWGLLTALLVAAAIHLLAIGIGWLVYRNDNPRNRVYRLSLLLSNAGFMALPLQQAILGEIGVFYGTAYVVMFNLMLWSYGVLVMDRGNGKLSWKKILISPGTVGVVAGVLVFVLPFDLPQIFSAPIAHLAALNTPLPMLFIGYYLSKVNFASALRRKDYYVGMALRLIVLPVVSVALLYLFGIRGTMLVSMSIAVSAPTAASVPMFATRYKGDTETAVNMVALSTVASLVTMPVIVALTQLLP